MQNNNISIFMRWWDINISNVSSLQYQHVQSAHWRELLDHLYVPCAHALCVNTFGQSDGALLRRMAATHGDASSWLATRNLKQGEGVQDKKLMWRLKEKKDEDDFQGH